VYNCNHLIHQSLAKYTASADYINNLAFDYFETYSLQSGMEYEENKKLLKAEFDRLKVRKEKRNNLTTDEEARFSELQRLVLYTQYLLDEKGTFHHSSKKTGTFPANDPMIDRLKTILNTKITETPHFLCAPVYRDAVVFYNNNHQIISVLNVCLSCMYMETVMNSYVNGDYETYDLLKRFFIEIGHDVEKPDYFIMDEIRKLKGKHKK
jgi:hypothetical protein